MVKHLQCWRPGFDSWVGKIPWRSVQFLGWEDPLEECMATHSSILAWRIPIDRGAGRLQSSGVAKSRTRLKCLSTHAELGAILAPSPSCCGICSLAPLIFHFFINWGSYFLTAELWGLTETMSIKYLIHYSHSIIWLFILSLVLLLPWKSCHFDPKDIILM